jgi:FlaA1/EpsC-like NDP-sugar epimerase
MTIPEACQLILQAGAMGKGGEIFILDMSTPIKINDMARDLIRLSGFEPDVDSKIEYIGLRAGEKLYEELIAEGENIVPTRPKKNHGA